MKAKFDTNILTNVRTNYIKRIIYLSFLLIPNAIFSQNKEMIKLEWYHYIFLSPVLIVDAMTTSYEKLKKGIQEQREFQGLSELHKAVIRSDMEKIKQLIAAQNDTESKDKNGETPLFYALDRNQVRIAKFLIENNADVNVRNINGRHIIQPAIQNNQYDILKLMLKHGLKLQLTENGDTALTLTCNLKPDNFKFIQMFVEHGVPINQKDKYRYTALMYIATSESPKLDIVQYLIKKGADVNEKDIEGRSILRLLIERKTMNLNLIKILVNQGADLYSKDKDGISIFEYIRKYYDDPDNDEVVLYLKAHR